MLIALILLIGCTVQQPASPIICNKPYIQIGTECCLDNNNNAICDKDETGSLENETSAEEDLTEGINNSEETEQIEVEEVPEVNEEIINQLPERNFTIEELGNHIYTLTNVPQLFKEVNISEKYILDLKNKNHLLFTSNNQFKGWVIEVINNKEDQLQTMEDFYNYVRAEKWEGWRYYMNETTWHWLSKPLTEDELKEIVPDYDYKTRYHTDLYSNWIDWDIKESAIKIADEQVLQYRFETMIFTPDQEDGYWIGNWETAILVYKIPCTKDTVIYYRPSFGIDFGYVGHTSQKKETSNKNWERDIQIRLPETINYSQQIMKFCGINNKMFDNTEFRDYEKNEKLVQNWKVYYAVVFNHSFDADIALKPQDPDNETFKIEYMNITFTSYDKEEDLKLLRVKIELSTEQINRTYGDATLYSGALYFGDIIKKDGISLEHGKFERNTSIIFRPYFGYKESPEYYKYYVGQPVIQKLT